MGNNGSAAFYRLDPRVQKWIWQQDWKTLRDIQENSIVPVLEKEHDIIISAATAGGKTEAAFLPIFTDAINKKSISGVHTLAICPLKALINDQTRRMESLGELTEVMVTPWHGDVAESHKSTLLKKPQGILLITPESLESILVNKSSSCHALFAALSYIVIDELHAFIGTERGKQLQSLLNRVDFYTQSQPPRIGLSATLGDFDKAFLFLRTSRKKPIRLIKSSSYSHDIKLLLKGYAINANGVSDQEGHTVDDVIVDDLYANLRGTTNLAFANSRAKVEYYSDALRRKCEESHVPNEFFPHHGNLSKEIRHDLESAMQSGKRPATAICTMTLELGIDIGKVNSVAQVGVPPSVSSLRQRLGRSGRRDAPSILRAYISENEVGKGSNIGDELRLELVQTIATIELLLEKWFEPPEVHYLHLSTLVQQIMALLAQYGGFQPKSGWEFLCQNGPFNNITPDVFKEVLIALKANEVIKQDHTGTLVIGVKGEKIINHYSFYSAFCTPEEFILEYNGSRIGTLPIDKPLMKGEYIIFSGTRWLVLDICMENKIISLARSQGGKPPSFTGEGFCVHDEIRKKMKKIYDEQLMPCYLDAVAKKLLQEGHEWFNKLGLTHKNVFFTPNTTYLFPWLGDRTLNTIAIELGFMGIKAQKWGCCIEINKIAEADFLNMLKTRTAYGKMNAIDLAKQVVNKESNKYDYLLNEDLLSLDYASRSLDTEASWAFWQTFS